MPKLGKKKVTLKQLSQLAKEERIKALEPIVKANAEQFTRLADTIRNIRLPDFSSLIEMTRSPLEGIDVSALNTRDYEAETNQKILTELMLEEIRVR